LRHHEVNGNQQEFILSAVERFKRPKDALELLWFKAKSVEVTDLPNYPQNNSKRFFQVLESSNQLESNSKTSPIIFINSLMKSAVSET
jgi:hypothetical protein